MPLDPVVQGAGFHNVAEVIENNGGSYPLQHTHRLVEVHLI